jgi:hypothetical protein
VPQKIKRGPFEESPEITATDLRLDKVMSGQFTGNHSLVFCIAHENGDSEKGKRLDKKSLSIPMVPTMDK